MAEKHIFFYIDGAGADGHLGLKLPLQWYGHCLREGTKGEKLKALINSIFYGWHPFIGLLDRRPKRLKELEADFKVEGDWVTFRINLCKLLWLPGENPKAELAEMRKLLEAMKPYFEEFAGKNPRMSLQNNRDGNGRVYGTFFLGGEGLDVVRVAQHLKTLDDVVDASPVLQHFKRSVALDLGKLGPWSWSPFTEDVLWGDHQGPNYKAIYARVVAERDAKEAAKAAT